MEIENVKLNRNMAIDFLAYSKYLKINNSEEYEGLLLDSGEEYDEHDIYSLDNMNIVMNVLRHYFLGVTNSFLQEQISKAANINVMVVGKEEILQKCPCCGYRTISKRGEYEICRLCNWEDEGNDDDEAYSSPNRTTLGEGRISFQSKVRQQKIETSLLKMYYR